ncbi:invasion associated locus B family protein [Oricola sp.]|uniref:invasion associated locus B family protein n=1 Tax=Oricola sp. TaxID=1979950 RepID=UPI003BAB8910
MLKRSKAISALIAAGVVVAGASAAAAQTPKRIGEFTDWGAFSYASPTGKVCYALSVPTSEAPGDVSHGDNFFLVTQRTGQNVNYEPQFMAGYSLKENSKVTVDVDGKDFVFFTKANSAWVENAAQEPALVAAMKAGRSMTVKATSKRGTNTTYVYSLSGVTAALEAIEGCR